MTVGVGDSAETGAFDSDGSADERFTIVVGDRAGDGACLVSDFLRSLLFAGLIVLSPSASREQEHSRQK